MQPRNLQKATEPEDTETRRNSQVSGSRLEHVLGDDAAAFGFSSHENKLTKGFHYLKVLLASITNTRWKSLLSEFGSKGAKIHQFQSLDKEIRENPKMLGIAFDPRWRGGGNTPKKCGIWLLI